MAKVFDGSFPGNAAGNGNAHVIDNDFEPGEAPPVDASAAPDSPIVPDTGPTVDPSTGLPLIPVVEALNGTPVEEADLPEEVPDFLFG